MDQEIFVKPDAGSKTISTFLRDIWHPVKSRNQRKVIYNEYRHTNKKQTSNFVNDFIHNQSYLCSNLSTEQIQGIHERNAQHATSDGSSVNNTPSSPPLQKQLFTAWSPDILVTESILDKFDIIPGSRRARLQQFYMQSKVLYQYLNCQLGNQDIVRLRRKLMRLKFSSHISIGSDKMKIIARGSRSDGLNMTGSDTDVLCEIGSAYEKKFETPTNLDIYQEYDSMSGSLGYVTVTLVCNGIRTIISSDIIKQTTREVFSSFKYMHSTAIHGPSFATKESGDDYDYVPCLKSSDWPDIAHEWIFRKRNFGWPSQEMINYIVKLGCHIVPIGNKKDHKNEVEWRLSFSDAEELLVWSFNHIQLLTVPGQFNLAL